MHVLVPLVLVQLPAGAISLDLEGWGGRFHSLLPCARAAQVQHLPLTAHHFALDRRLDLTVWQGRASVSHAFRRHRSVVKESVCDDR